ncbi:MAG: Bug family tripartite tricarboxylate transporter substrate binding protein [Beijerinckiaceae bacterium]
MKSKRHATLLCAAIIAPFVCAQASAETVEEFYKARPLKLTVGSAAASGFTLYARVLSRHMPQHIPGQPAIVIENLPGASGLRHMDHLVTVAAKDGSVIGLLNPSVTTAPLMTPDVAKHTSEKLAWIGSANSEVSTCHVWPHAKVQSAEDLRKRELVFGGSGAAGSSGVGALLLKSMFGFKFRIVSGYQGSADIMLAGARGEIDGACILLSSAIKAQYWGAYQRGEFRVILQMPPGNDPDLKGVANTIDFAATDEQRQALEFVYGFWAYGRPFAAPAETPADRLAALRSALKATLENQSFLAEAKKVGLDVGYMPPDEIDRRVKAIERTPKSVVDKVLALAAPPK